MSESVKQLHRGSVNQTISSCLVYKGNIPLPPCYLLSLASFPPPSLTRARICPPPHPTHTTMRHTLDECRVGWVFGAVIALVALRGGRVKKCTNKSVMMSDIEGFLSKFGRCSTFSLQKKSSGTYMIRKRTPGLGPWECTNNIYICSASQAEQTILIYSTIHVTMSCLIISSNWAKLIAVTSLSIHCM
jgi:hypothetical protein